ncbi:MAG: T9SS type A sorting domain-containing protein [Sphingobacteriales bacterium]|nr:T9SS type A sorting domain-containing protein [Sphingobacteriales bacterium]
MRSKEPKKVVELQGEWVAYQKLDNNQIDNLKELSGTAFRYRADAQALFRHLQADNTLPLPIYPERGKIAKTAIGGSTEKNTANLASYLSPNPATDKLFIHSPEALTNIAIYNTLGQQFPLLEGARGSTNSPSERWLGAVNETQFGAENEVSVAHLTSGIYFVEVRTKSGKVMTHKFVKQ